MNLFAGEVEVIERYPDTKVRKFARDGNLWKILKAKMHKNSTVLQAKSWYCLGGTEEVWERHRGRYGRKALQEYLLARGNKIVNRDWN